MRLNFIVGFFTRLVTKNDTQNEDGLDASVYTRNAQKDLLKDIEETKSALDLAYSNFQNVVEPDLIDSTIYEVNAAQKRYTFLLECAKKSELHQSGSFY